MVFWAPSICLAAQAAREPVREYDTLCHDRASRQQAVKDLCMNAAPCAAFASRQAALIGA